MRGGGRRGSGLAAMGLTIVTRNCRGGQAGCLASGQKRAPSMISHERGVYLATTYSHRTFRPTIIGAEAFHFRVRNGTGWFHLALVTRGQRWVDGVSFQHWDSGYLEPCLSSFVCLRGGVLWRDPLADIRMEPSDLICCCLFH